MSSEERLPFHHRSSVIPKSRSTFLLVCGDFSDHMCVHLTHSLSSRYLLSPPLPRRARLPSLPSPREKSGLKSIFPIQNSAPPTTPAKNHHYYQQQEEQPWSSGACIIGSARAQLSKKSSRRSSSDQAFMRVDANADTASGSQTSCSRHRLPGAALAPRREAGREVRRTGDGEGEERDG